ncbi:MAG: serine hydrolase, partial [Myxococcales bacterium]|nr:serine hydrolase [Myxococcales bacterium]
IKTFLAVATLAELNRDVDGEIPLGTRIMRCRDDRGGCEPPREDEDDSEGAEAEDGKKKHEKLYLGQELQKLLAYSDNDAYNRLWDILGHRRANEAVVRLGFPGVRLNHKMNAPPDKSLKTLRTTLLVPGKAAIRVPRRVSDLLLAPTDAARLEEGEAYNDAGKRIDEPMSFANKNHASLSDLARLHLSLVRPDHPDALPLGLTDGQREHLLRAMTRPLRGAHADDHAPFGPGVTAVLDPKRVRYISKSGRAYGFHIENAYVEDTESGRAILLTAGCYANDNGVLNDDDYSYDALSRPLLAAIGEEMTRAFLTEDAAVTDDGPR